jgi:hypothetical protein
MVSMPSLVEWYIVSGQAQTQKAANNIFVSRPICHNRLIVFFNEMRRKKKKNMQMDKKL